MTEHTPTPYRISGRFLLGADGSEVAYLFAGWSGHRRVERASATANGELLRDACNSHAALVEACGLLLEVVNDSSAMSADGWICVQEQREIAKAALALAAKSQEGGA